MHGAHDPAPVPTGPQTEATAPVWLTGSACTGIALTTVGGDPVVARTIEWGRFDLHSRLVVSPRGHAYTSSLPQGLSGLSWTSRHGFVGISVSDDRFIGEGMNEAGLNAGLFYFAGYGSLATFDPDDVADNVVDMDLVRWMLSQFATVEEVTAALASVTVVPVYIDEQGNPSPTAHWRVTDRAGGSIVIEIMDGGQVHVHDNHVGVITNSPEFPWHLRNLDIHINVRPGTVAPRDQGGVTLRSFGTGTAAWGLPGDYSPTSRFVRAAFFRASAPALPTTLDAVSQAFHILHNFDIPLGTEFGDDERDQMPALASATQWTAVSDLASGHFYFTTMNDSAVRRLALASVDLGAGTERAVALDTGTFTFQDVIPPP